jgi:hypothetical protein
MLAVHSWRPAPGVKWSALGAFAYSLIGQESQESRYCRTLPPAPQ